MNPSQRRLASIAYACHLAIATFIVLAWGAGQLAGPPGSPQAFAVAQGMGMLVLLPLSMAAIAALLAASAIAWRLLAWWRREPALALLPALAFTMIVVFLFVDERRWPAVWLTVATSAYCGAAFAFGLRWFLRRRV